MQQSRLGEVGVVALDGTKMKSNASLSANRTKEQIIEEVKHILEDVEAIDNAEDAKLGNLREEGELPPELRNRKSRQKRLAECQNLLEAEEASRKTRI